MTYSLLTNDYSRELLRSRNNPLIQHIELYSLFKRDCSNRWIRVSSMSYNLKLAYRVFGEQLAKDITKYRIKRVTIELNEAR